MQVHNLLGTKPISFDLLENYTKALIKNGISLELITSFKTFFENPTIISFPSAALVVIKNCDLITILNKFLNDFLPCASNLVSLIEQCEEEKDKSADLDIDSYSYVQVCDNIRHLTQRKHQITLQMEEINKQFFHALKRLIKLRSCLNLHWIVKLFHLITDTQYIEVIS